MERKRSSGFLAMHLATASSVVGETLTLGFMVRSGGGSSFTCAMRMFTLSARSKGTLPVSISYMMMPSE